MKTIRQATILNIDCMEYMSTVPDNHFDLAIVDPPYGINVNHNMGRRKGDKSSDYKKAYWDNSPPDHSYFIELGRVSKNQIIWGANHFMDIISKRSPCWIVWDKLFSSEVSFASCELAYTTFKSTTKRFKCSSNRKNGIHPTQKPITLYEWLLTKYAKPGQKILDTHLGSGSSAIAANNLGYEFIGCEIDEDYYQSACDRIASYPYIDKVSA